MENFGRAGDNDDDDDLFVLAAPHEILRVVDQRCRGSSLPVVPYPCQFRPIQDDNDDDYNSAPENTHPSTTGLVLPQQNPLKSIVTAARSHNFRLQPRFSAKILKDAEQSIRNSSGSNTCCPFLTTTF
jgi:hypothetical protein